MNNKQHPLAKGKLKIYLGAAPGVGKTHAMLQDALAKQAQGLDVVIGALTTYGRPHIEALVSQFETLPQPIVELDLNAALKRSPRLLVTDDISHVNVPGLRHEKRWQDIKELLDRGIDVYTTLNVQHIESLNDTISHILHVTITQTVPDSILASAAVIELVDLDPEELLKRLEAGGVYFSKALEQVKSAFFDRSALVALRELSLRVTAEHVNTKVLLYRQDQGIKEIWSTKESILVCVGSGIGSLKLIRVAKQLANKFQIDWIAVHVVTDQSLAAEQKRNAAIQNLRFASQLGAKTRLLIGVDIVKEVINFAHENNITLIMTRKRLRSRWQDLFLRRLSDELVRYSGDINVYVMSEETEEVTLADITSRSASKNRLLSILQNVWQNWQVYGWAIFSIILATILSCLVTTFSLLSINKVILFYLLGVTLVSLFGKMGPVVFAAILSVLAHHTLFVEPRFIFELRNAEYLFSLTAMLLVAQLVIHLVGITRKQSQSAHFTEHKVAALHALNRQLASMRGTDKILEIGAWHIAGVFESKVLILFPENDELIIRAKSGEEQALNDKEQSIARWVYDLGQIAGLGTDTLSSSDALYVPLLASHGSLGVLRARPLQAKLFTPEQMDLLEDCANQLALVLEADSIHEQTQKLELQTETDRIRNALLQYVSQDLRIPLAAVIAAANTLKEFAQKLDPKQIEKLGKEIYTESEELTRLIDNLFQITYLEAGSLKLQKSNWSLKEIIERAIETVAKNKNLKDISVQIHIPENIPKVYVDGLLMKEVFINVIDNAVKFSTSKAPIKIEADLEKNKVLVSVKDHGSGIMLEEANKLFEKFYRGRMLTAQKGLGLGLAICKKIIEAHGGRIWMENAPEGGGAILQFTLPLEPAD